MRLATQKMKYCFGHLAPVAAVPCSNEARGSEAYKQKTGRAAILPTGTALQITDISRYEMKLSLSL
jgi:hypothetical protein